MDLQHLNVFLQQLNSSYSSACARDAIETLLKIHRNIHFNKEDPKYKKLQLNNPAFSLKVWNVPPAQKFMLECGWTQVDDALYFINDTDLLLIMNVLLEHRFVAPQNSEWESETKIENLHTSQQHEESLRAKAAVERDKELAEFKKDKIYRQQLAQTIKQQIADDRKHNRRQFTEPVVANKLDRGSRLPPAPASPGEPAGPADPAATPFRRLGD